MNIRLATIALLGAVALGTPALAKDQHISGSLNVSVFGYSVPANWHVGLGNKGHLHGGVSSSYGSGKIVGHYEGGEFGGVVKQGGSIIAKFDGTWTNGLFVGVVRDVNGNPIGSMTGSNN